MMWVMLKGIGDVLDEVRKNHMYMFDPIIIPAEEHILYMAVFNVLTHRSQLIATLLERNSNPFLQKFLFFKPQ